MEARYQRHSTRSRWSSWSGFGWTTFRPIDENSGLIHIHMQSCTCVRTSDYIDLRGTPPVHAGSRSACISRSRNCEIHTFHYIPATSQ